MIILFLPQSLQAIGRAGGELLWHETTEKRWMKLKKALLAKCFFGGSGWIRTTEVTDNRFTVCPLWPLGNAPNYKAPHTECTRLFWSW